MKKIVPLFEHKFSLESYKRKISKETDYHKVKIHKSSKQIYMIIQSASLGSIFWGYSLLAYNPAYNTINNILGYSHESEQFKKNIQTYIICSLLGGGLLGSILCLNLIKYFARRKTMMAIDLIGCIGCFVSIIYPNYYSICIGRFIQGIACGMNTVVVPLYIREITPLQMLGGTSIISPGNLFLGSLIAYVVGLGYPETGDYRLWYWRFAFSFPILFCAMRTLILTFKYKFDTPLSYLIQGKDDEANFVLNYLYEYPFVNDLTQDFEYEAHKKKKRGSYKGLFSKQMYQKTLIAMSLMYFSQLIGNNATTFYSTNLFNVVDNVVVRQGRILTGISYVLALIFVIFTGFLVQRYGKKQIVVICASTLTLVNFCLAVAWLYAYKYSSGNLHNYNDVPQSLWDAIACLLIMFRSNIALGTVAPLFGYVADVSGDKGQSLATSFYWISAIFVATLFNVIKVQWSFFIFGVHSLLLVIIFVWKIKDTKGLSRRELEQLYFNKPKKSKSLSQPILSPCMQKDLQTIPEQNSFLHYDNMSESTLFSNFSGYRK